MPRNCLRILFAGSIALFPLAAQAAPDNTLGMALMSASVDAAPSPNIIRGSGAVSASRPQTGFVDVVFDRDLSSCACTASTGYYEVGSYTGGSMASANCPYAAPNSARVIVRSENATFIDSPFHLIVFCPK